MSRLCTIIVTVRNNPGATRICLESLFAQTEEPYKVLIIDDGSDKQTHDFLLKFCTGKNNFQIKRFDENIGYIKAANYALETIDTPYICLLDNNTILTNGWLAECSYILDSYSDIGIISPATNEISGRFAKHYLSGSISNFRGKFIETNGCSGPCMIIKKEAVGKVGYFDPIYQDGYFAETDFCLRARQYSFRSVIALGAYITRAGRSFFDKLPSRERDKSVFESKWGKPERVMVFLKKFYSPERLERAKTWIVMKCAHRAMIDLYSKDGNWWAEGLHLSIRRKKCVAYNFTVLYLLLLFKKKAYDTVITDMRMPDFMGKLLENKLKGFYDFTGL